jgi:hypothetical protein
MQTDRSATSGDARKLFLVGFSILFLELVLIRYLAGTVWNMGYFPNLVLLSVFVGMGLGFIFHQRVAAGFSNWVFQGAVFLLLGLVGFIHFVRPAVPGFQEFEGDVGGEVYFTAASKTGSDATTYLLFVACFLTSVLIFACLAQRAAKLFQRFTPLTAYTLDIAGSCAGIVTFMLMSFFGVPAWGWFLVFIPIFLLAMEGRGIPRFIPVLPILVVAYIARLHDQTLVSSPEFKGHLEVAWSPYQKVEYIHNPANAYAHGIYVNGISHQAMLNAEQISRHYYQVPHTERRNAGMAPYKKVLIIGAGSGNDVAASLMNGAEEIHAVEIDPVIAGLGRAHHPAKPWADKRVKQIVDDGRAFLTRTTEKYDLVIFALTDSLVKVSSMAQLRLENYLFTVDSLRRAYQVLSPDGDIVLYNYYRREWLIDKYQRMIHEATGKYPITLYKRADFQMLTVGKQRAAATEPTFTTRRTDLATDDWPFPYLRNRGIPHLYGYALASVSIILALAALFLWSRDRRARRTEGDAPFETKLAFVFMGIAFLLLETKSIVQFSLLFGTTWINTSLVFLGVLISVLAANWTAVIIRSRRVLPVIFALLVGSCFLTFIYPLRNLLSIESAFLRFIVASLLTFSPIFFANLIFSLTFRDQRLAERIFGWNLLGATLGGLVEYTSMAFGYNALGLIVVVCYGAVFLLLALGRRSEARSTPGSLAGDHLSPGNPDVLGKLGNAEPSAPA